MAQKMRGFSSYDAKIPTKIDVDALLAAFPPETLTTDTLITYAQVEEVIKIKRGAKRWAGVTHAWKEALKKRRVFVSAIPNEGYQVLDDNQKVEKAGDHVERGFRQIEHSTTLLAHVNPVALTEDKRKDYEVGMRLVTSVKQAFLSQPKPIDLLSSSSSSSSNT